MLGDCDWLAVCDSVSVCVWLGDCDCVYVWDGVGLHSSFTATSRTPRTTGAADQLAPLLYETKAPVVVPVLPELKVLELVENHSIAASDDEITSV